MNATTNIIHSLWIFHFHFFLLELLLLLLVGLLWFCSTKERDRLYRCRFVAFRGEKAAWKLKLQFLKWISHYTQQTKQL